MATNLYLNNLSSTNISSTSLILSNLSLSASTMTSLNITSATTTTLVANTGTISNLLVSANTASTNSSTGSLVVSGGVGVAGSVYSGPIRSYGLVGFQQSYSIFADMTFITNGSSYSNVYTFTNSSLTTSFTGTTSSSFTATKYNGATGGSVSIDPRNNYLLCVSGSGPNQILSALYLIQCGNSNTGINVTNIGTNGNYGTVTVSVVSNNGTFSGGGSNSLGVTIAASSSTAAFQYYFTMTFTNFGSS
jgi:hypothetical protein